MEIILNRKARASVHWIWIITIAIILIILGRAGLLAMFGAVFGLLAFLAVPFTLAFIFEWGFEGMLWAIVGSLVMLLVVHVVLERV